MPSDCMINAAWEDRGKKKTICRWFVAWKSVGSDEIAGAVAGFSGGGTFQVERFYGKTQKGKLTALWIDCTDCINGKGITFDKLRKRLLGLARKVSMASGNGTTTTNGAIATKSYCSMKRKANGSPRRTCCIWLKTRFRIYEQFARTQV